MSSPRKKTDDCVSSPDENDDTSASARFYDAARLLEENKPEKLLSNASDADVSNSSDSVQTVIDTGISSKPRESSEEVAGTSTKLPRSPKKAYKRTKSDTKTRGERDDDSSDEIDPEYLERSPKKMKYDIKEEMVDSFEESTSGMSLKRLPLDSEKLEDSKDDSSSEKCKSDTTDNKTTSSKNFKSSNIKSDIDENARDVPVQLSALKKSDEKFKKASSEPPEFTSSTTKEKVNDAAEAGFTLVKVSDLIAAAVSSTIHAEERCPHSGTSNDDTDTTKHSINPTTCLEEKEHTDADKIVLHQEKSSDLIAANTINIFGQAEGIENQDMSEKPTEHRNTQNVDLLRTESSGDSNFSIERMEFSSESNIDRGTETNTDVEKMDCSSESCTGFQSIKYNAGLEKMECKSESSISPEEMELESASVKSTEVEGMEYSSESVLADNDSLSYQGHDFISEVTNPIESITDDSSKPEKELSIPRIFECVPAGSSELEKEPSIPRIDEDELFIPSIIVEGASASRESQSNNDEVENINKSNTTNETIDTNRQFSVPRAEASDDTVEYECDQNKGDGKDKDSKIVSKLTSDEKRTVEEKVPLDGEEPSNIDNESSSKRKRSTDSDKDTEEENLTNVSESTDAPEGTAASSIECPDTDSEEFGESKDTDCKKSPKKFKRK